MVLTYGIVSKVAGLQVHATPPGRGGMENGNETK